MDYNMAMLADFHQRQLELQQQEDEEMEELAVEIEYVGKVLKRWAKDIDFQNSHLRDRVEEINEIIRLVKEIEG